MDLSVNDLVLVSVDDHLVEPPDMFERHVPAKYRDRAPRIEERDGAQVWVFEGKVTPNIGIAATVGRPREELGLDRTTAAEVLSRLEGRGLVTRKPNPRDRRARLARITRRGRSLTAAMFSSMQRAQDRMCAPLSQKERDVFMATLIRLIEANNEYGRGALRID